MSWRSRHLISHRHLILPPPLFVRHHHHHHRHHSSSVTPFLYTSQRWRQSWIVSNVSVRWKHGSKSSSANSNRQPKQQQLKQQQQPKQAPPPPHNRSKKSSPPVINPIPSITNKGILSKNRNKNAPLLPLSSKPPAHQQPTATAASTEAQPSWNYPPIYFYGFSHKKIRLWRRLTVASLVVLGIIDFNGSLPDEKEEQQQQQASDEEEDDEEERQVNSDDNEDDDKETSIIMPLFVEVSSECLSVWRKGKRRIYLLGSAHCSSHYIVLIKLLIRKVQPQAIFIELDTTRVMNCYTWQLPVPIPFLKQHHHHVPKSSSPFATATTEPCQSITWMFPRTEYTWIKVMLQQLLGKKCRGPMSFYQQTFYYSGPNSIVMEEEETFTPQQQVDFQWARSSEFYEAVCEGQKIGATIILGDHSHSRTHRRLLWAKLLDFLYFLRKSFVEGMKDSDLDHFTDFLSPQEDSVTVSRVHVRAINTDMKRYLPNQYSAMVQVRDAYMAVGLNVVANTNQFDTMVAVVGIGHLDGIEERLQRFGWKQVH